MWAFGAMPARPCRMRPTLARCGPTSRHVRGLARGRFTADPTEGVNAEGEWEKVWPLLDMPVEDRRSQAFMSRRSFALVALGEGWVTEAEAIAWAAGQAIPAWVEQIIDANIPEASRALVKIQTLTDVDVKRTGQLMPMLQAAKGVSDAELDALFGIA
jgi:hypothetical protein